MTFGIWEVGAKRHLNGTSKINRHTDRQTDRQTDTHMDESKKKDKKNILSYNDTTNYKQIIQQLPNKVEAYEA